MSEKLFTMHKENKYKEEWYAYPFCIKENGEVILERIPLNIAEKVRDKLNELSTENRQLKKENDKLIKEIKSKNEIIELYYEMVRLNE